MTNDQKFRNAIDFVFMVEGYMSDNPYDPGGKTKYGIAQKWHPDVDVQSLTKEGAEVIYKRTYWDRCRCGDYSWPLALCIFDAAVQHGPAKPIEWINLCKGDWARFNLLRLEHYAKIANVSDDSKRIFLLGWMNRMVKLNNVCRKADDDE